MMSTAQLWNVRFVRDFSVETVTVIADTEDDAIGLAETLMTDETGEDYSAIGGEAELA
jgi:hypothetical protein